MPLRPTASAPPTVPVGGIATACPCSASAASSSSTGSPAPHCTVISSGRTQSIPLGAITTRTPSTGPPGDRDRIVGADLLCELGKVHSDPRPGGDRHDVAASRRARQDLARVGAPLGVEGVAQSFLGGEVDLGEHQRHVVTLLEPDP